MALGLPLTEIATLLREGVQDIESLIDNEQRFHEHGFSHMSPECQDVFGNMATYLKKIREKLPFLEDDIALIDCLNKESFCAAHELMQAEKATSPNTIPTWEFTEYSVVRATSSPEEALQRAQEAVAQGYDATVVLPDPNNTEEQDPDEQAELLEARSVLPLIEASLRATIGLELPEARQAMKDTLKLHGFTDEEAQNLANHLHYRE